jgi:hypothetical protein
MWRWAQGRILVLRPTDHQRHITREATEEIKLDGFRSLAPRCGGELYSMFARDEVRAGASSFSAVTGSALVNT